MLVNQAYQALAELELLKRAGSDIIPSAIGMPGPAQRQRARGRAGLPEAAAFAERGSWKASGQRGLSPGGRRAGDDDGRSAN